MSSAKQVGVLFRSADDRAIVDRLSPDFATVAIPAGSAKSAVSKNSLSVFVAEVGTVTSERGLANRLSRSLDGVPVVLIANETSQDVIDLAVKLNGARIVERNSAPEVLSRIIEDLIAGGATDLIHRSSVELIGESPAVRNVRRSLANLAATPTTVLISGEPGSGKMLAAHILHRLSGASESDFRVVACSTHDERELEHQLFDTRSGLLSALSVEQRGTVVLDEVDTIPAPLQSRVIAALRQRGTYYSSSPVGPRLLATTTTRPDGTTTLDAATRDGTFSRDLYDRLTELRLEMPPLRERRIDIRLLWEHFLGTQRTTTPRALMRLAGHDWPGNIRELQNVARYAIQRAGAQRIEEGHLPPHLVPQHEPTRVPMARAPGMTLEELERSAILLTYQSLGENAQATANALGISVRKVHYRLRRYREEGWLGGGGEVAPADTANDDPDRSALQGPRRLLLAEDDDELRWSLTKLLEAEGFHVTALSSGTEVLEHLGGKMLFDENFSPPDVIVSDVRMPGVSGLSVLEGVRQRGWKTPVVLITAFGDEDVRAKAMRLDATVLSKPIDLDRLQLVLARTA